MTRREAASLAPGSVVYRRDTDGGMIEWTLSAGPVAILQRDGNERVLWSLSAEAAQGPSLSMCPAKQRYDTPDEAAAALAAVREKRLAKGAPTVELRVYDCPHCGGYHMTAQPKRGER